MGFPRINRRKHLLECQNKRVRNGPNEQSARERGSSAREERLAFRGAPGRGRQAPLPRRAALPELRDTAAGKPGHPAAGKPGYPAAAAGNVGAVGAFKRMLASCLDFCRALSLNTHCYFKKKKKGLLKISLL